MSSENSSTNQRTEGDQRENQENDGEIIFKPRNNPKNEQAKCLYI